MQNNITGEHLLESAYNFIENENMESFNEFRMLWPFHNSRAIAVIATPIAFINPERFPMIDRRIAKWVIANYESFNQCYPDGPQLFPLQNIRGVLTMNHFNFYLQWIHWTRFMSEILTQNTDIDWRARDVEMAVFTAWGGRDQPHPYIDLDCI